MSQPRLNLTCADFDAYLPERAASNAFTRPRIEVKQRVMAWARHVAERLAAEGIATSVHGSDEHPSLRNKKRVDCQWAFFWRDVGSRDELERLLDQGRPIAEAIDDPNPCTRHAFLALRLDASAVEVCFAVHPDAKVDVDNLRARLATAEAEGAPAGEPSLAEELMSALRRLPDEFRIGTGPEDRQPCASATAQAIVGTLERAAAGQVPLWIGWSVPREIAVEHTAILDEQLEDALAALAPVYQLVAWSRENDHIALDRRLAGVEQERARTHAELEAENERWRAERAAEAERLRELSKARTEEHRREAAGPSQRPSLGTLFKSRSDLPPKRAPHVHAPPPAREPEKLPSEPAPKPDEGKLARVASPAAPPSIEKGTRVAVKTGPFAGKVGVVNDLDGRGGARVLLGLLSTRLDMSDLEMVPEGRERPALPVSHHRPAAPSPRKTR